jgi:truncated hemoglobin YjbI
MTREIIEKILQDYFKVAVSDPMIGYLFTGKDIARLIQKEIELTLGFFDGKTAYTGRGLRFVHGPLRVKKGEFDRRLVLLAQAMAKNNLPENLQKAWLEHNEKARELVLHAELDC